MREDIIKLRKAIKDKELELMLIGNAVYLTDTAAGQDYRIGNLKGRAPASSQVERNTDQSCPICGHILEDEDQYCPGCGMKIAVPCEI